MLRTKGPLAGHAELVPFYDPDHLSTVPDYVTTVLGAEWSSFYPYETLKVGAIAVKQYGWYYTIVYRGGVDDDGQCYDVRDDTNDQYYQPELHTPAAIHLRAIADTWRTSLRKYDWATHKGRFILTGYRTWLSDRLRLRCRPLPHLSAQRIRLRQAPGHDHGTDLAHLPVAPP